MMMRLFRFIGFLFFYLGEVLMANIRIAIDVLTPQDLSKPRFVKVPLEPMTPRQLLILTNVVTMTPGTLCIEVSEDNTELLIHSLYSDSDDELIQSIKNDYERKVKDVF